MFQVNTMLNRSGTITANDGLRLQEVGDFGHENCLPPMKLIRSTDVHLTTDRQFFVVAVTCWQYLSITKLNYSNRYLNFSA